MDEFPSNSQQPHQHRPVREDGPGKHEPEKKISRVVEGEVIRRKRPLGKRFKEVLLGGDSRSVGEYVFMDVLIPAIRDMISDAATASIERMVYGSDVRPHNRRPSQRIGGGFGGNVRYDRVGSPLGRREDPRDRGREISRRARATHDFDEVILPTRVEADEVLTQMFDLLERYEVATVADLYLLVGVTAKYTDDKWGWTDLRGSGVTRTRGGGYLLDLPAPEELKD